MLSFFKYPLNIASFLVFLILPAIGQASNGDKLLLTPGPLTTSQGVKEAMLHDYGSRDPDFIKMNRSVLQQLLTLVNGHKTHVVVPLQGCGTFIVEAMLRTFVPQEGTLLILANGVYGRRMAAICQAIPRPHAVLEWAENEPIDPILLAQVLQQHPEYSHVAMVYCETTSGLLNPIEKISEVVADANRKLLIDAMSAFGALPLDAASLVFDAVVASSNKCLQGVPGIGFCIACKEAIDASAGQAQSLSFDLFAQWKEMEMSGQWRFTPPTHAILALHQALKELDMEGGVAERGKRYRQNMSLLRTGMQALGFQPYLPEELQAPIIATFLMPKNPAFDFHLFYERLKEKGFVIYPGKLTLIETFRIGCIGDIHPTDIQEVLKAIKDIQDSFNHHEEGML
jgi:2-aminoethylphosphonate-pyruvate transaminase